MLVQNVAHSSHHHQLRVRPTLIEESSESYDGQIGAHTPILRRRLLTKEQEEMLQEWIEGEVISVAELGNSDMYVASEDRGRVRYDLQTP
jgi:hypothetical protein